MVSKIINNNTNLYLKTILTTLKVHHLFTPFFSGIGTILLFHRVIPAEERSMFNRFMEVTPSYLENCIKFFLQNQYDVISLDEIYLRLTEKKFNRKFVCFTFDDGYIDNYTYAYPLFKKYNIPFAIYITTNMVNSELIMYNYILEDILLKLKTDHIEIAIKNKNHYFPCRTMSDKKNTFQDIANLIKYSWQSDNHSIIKELSERYNNNLFHESENICLNWEQLSEMGRDQRVTIGAHTINHHELNKLSHNELTSEILLSKYEIERNIGHSVDHFAYPYGSIDSYGEREIGVLKKAAFKTATTTNSGNLFAEHGDSLFELPRNIIDDISNNIDYLKLIISGTLSAIRKVTKL